VAGADAIIPFGWKFVEAGKKEARNRTDAAGSRSKLSITQTNARIAAPYLWHSADRERPIARHVLSLRWGQVFPLVGGPHLLQT